MKKSLYCLFGLLCILICLFISCDSETVYHTVTFKTESKTYATKQVEDGQTVKKPAADPKKTDYIFTGWLLNGQAYNFSSPVKSDLTLTASWKERKYKLIYCNVDANGTTPATAEYERGTTVNVAQGSWSLTPQGTTSETSVTINSDTTLYAIMDYDALTAIKAPCVIRSNDSSYDKYNTSLYIDPAWFFGTDNTTFNKNIAKLSSLLMAEAYDSLWLEVPSLNVGPAHSYFNTPADSNKNVYSALNFKDVTSVKMTPENHTVDKNDNSNYVLSHNEYDTTKSLVIVAIQGTASDNQWLSNIDVGYYDTSSPTNYYDGKDHTEWVSKENHKGFDVAANRIKAKVDQYIKEKVVDVHPGVTSVSVLITGHSRGASVANLLGSYYEQNPGIPGTSINVSPFTYTFACPLSTTSTTDCNSIFNFVNEDDVITHVPPVIGFKRFGESINVDLSKKKTTYKAKVGRDYNSPQYSKWKHLVESIEDNLSRDEIYSFVSLGKEETIDSSDLKYLKNYIKWKNDDPSTDKALAVKPQLFFELVNFLYVDSDNTTNGWDTDDYVDFLECLYPLFKSIGINESLLKLTDDAWTIANNGSYVADAHEKFTYILLTEIYCDSLQ